jgi:methylmalonyl-CoA mutase N-terminal domain/subunit
MVAAIERGWVQEEIEQAAYQQQLDVDCGRTVVVGVNRFAGGDQHTQPIGTANDAGEREQIERVCGLRARRDPRRWRAALNRVQEQAKSTENVMPAILEAVESCATVGEIAGSLRVVFGEHPAS